MAFDSMDKVLAALKGSDKNEIPDSVLKYVNKPNKAWSILQSRQTVKRLQPMDPRTPKPPDHTRFVCISDTHGRTNRIAQDLPEGDVLIHAGDFTMVGKPNEVSAFNEFLGSLSYPHKVVIAGNHDISFDPPSCETLWRMFSREPYGDPLEIKSTLTNCIYLEDSMVEINGIQIYGSPWTPAFREWAFMQERGDPIRLVWDKIPTTVDVLITHGPPLGHGDSTFGGTKAGCLDLLHTVQTRVKPQYHVFGHIHEGYGITTDGTTQFVNASTCTFRYQPTNPPMVFDVPNKTPDRADEQSEP